MSKRLKLKIFSSGIISVFIIIVIFVNLVFGGFQNMVDTWIMTAMTTLSHKWLATSFFSEERINEAIDRNTVEEVTEKINLNDIVIDIERQEEEKDDVVDEVEEVKDFEIVDIQGIGYRGKMMIVRDPSRIFLGITPHLGEKGLRINELAEKYDAIAGINAGGFSDPEWKGKGGHPSGLTISQGKVVFWNGEGYSLLDTERKNFSDIELKQYHDLIGFNRDNKLVLGRYRLREIIDMGITDAADFAPILVLNGKPTKMTGDGGWGIAPRTAIGQRKDGTLLLLVIDGRQPTHSIGAGVRHLRDIMVEYGAYNATNLDGGTSTVMYYNGNAVNKSCSEYSEFGRRIPTTFLINPKSSEE